MTTNLFRRLDVCRHILVTLGLRVNARFSSLDRQSERIHDDHDARVHLAEKEAHDFQIPAGPEIYCLPG